VVKPPSITTERNIAWPWIISVAAHLKLPTMPSLAMHTKHGVVRRRDDGVLDMMVPHLERQNGGH